MREMWSRVFRLLLLSQLVGAAVTQGGGGLSQPKFLPNSCNTYTHADKIGCEVKCSKRASLTSGTLRVDHTCSICVVHKDRE